MLSDQSPIPAPALGWDLDLGSADMCTVPYRVILMMCSPQANIPALITPSSRCASTDVANAQLSEEQSRG